MYNLVIISPDYVMPADTHRQCKNIYSCFGILDSEYMAIAVESAEMGWGEGGGGGRLTE